MEEFLKQHTRFKLDNWYEALHRIISERRAFLDTAGGNFLRFKTVVESLPDVVPSIMDLRGNQVLAGDEADISPDDKKELHEKLARLCPWRKGPFNLFGVDIDSEWQSWIKWNRLVPHLPELEGKKILDIGSSNGYYMFKMAAENPLFVLGLEPQSYFYYQYLAIQKYVQLKNVFCLPIPHDQLPGMDRYFDLVFCMGVLYHRKSPIEMLKTIHDSLRKGGQIVLENLVIDAKENLCLFPRDRYAKMRNVFFIPDLLAMESWLLRAGFTHIRCVDVAKTTCEEQRRTDWIQTESLRDFLDPGDPDKTIEGYPAPVRAIFIATA
ncbi:MAG: tRNA 5-methoxyuridine(34)/uridine 5-oxyacetic acid(34) synthase CmoB [Proteobacteria bacterium]|nr:tRNA 5-methoxyuridine(34)/uridine 5-oxyacetic acid(34) synthase CmoB [Desulfobacula sp.]MBU4132334.1 tRNA 5-methoxyuridine(34)/uridine 5-oxyacetic acid(34) synthase CmoB [Pseudomonadota bacterium]